MVSRESKVDYFASFLFFFFLLIIIKSGLLAGIRWSVCMLKSHRGLCMSFSRTGAGLCIYHLLVWSNLNFLRISQWITLPTQSCLALYSHCANLLHSLIIWLMVLLLLLLLFLEVFNFCFDRWLSPNIFSRLLLPLQVHHYNWYHSQFLCFSFFKLSGKIQVFLYRFAVFYFYSMTHRNCHIHSLTSSSC